MSRNDHMDPASLDLNKEDVIHALIALDTELNSLHRLCMEQGPFFKCIFEEISSDALRQGLKQNLRGMPANQSHSERSYWKPQITRTQIETIKNTVAAFSGRWGKFYKMYQRDRFLPNPIINLTRIFDHTPSPVSIMHNQFTNFTHNIIAICEYLTTPHDTTNTYEPPKIDPHETAKLAKNQQMWRQLNQCMTWIELNTDNEVEHTRITGQHGDLRAKIWGPIELLFGAMSYQPFNIEKLPLVITFGDRMQTALDAKTQKDTALYRAGLELIRDLKKLILVFKTEEPIDAPSDPEKQKSDSALSSLLARLTDRANMS